MKVSIIIPCYNEGENLSTLMAAVNNVDPCGLDVEYLLVNNGSQDDTGEQIDKYVCENIKKVTVPENKGYGYGLQCGIHAATGNYIGWIHGDIQIHPTELNQFFRYLASHQTNSYFMKGHRQNRGLFDQIFTWGQGIVNSAMFHMKLYDIAAIPVLYPAHVIQGSITDAMPNDFSIELFAYMEALKLGLHEVRFPVRLRDRARGKSSWNTGFKAKLRQSKRIFMDSVKIKRGEKVL